MPECAGESVRFDAPAEIGAAGVLNRDDQP